jgi:hypothetical protein
VDPRTAARLMAAGRAAIGLSLIATPTLATSMWLGRHARKTHAQVLVRALGARDLAIGLGALWALGGGGNPQPWLLGGVIADVTDVVATVAARDSLPATAVPLIASAGGVGAAIGAYGLVGLDGGAPSAPVPA